MSTFRWLCVFVFVVMLFGCSDDPDDICTCDGDVPTDVNGDGDSDADADGDGDDSDAEPTLADRLFNENRVFLPPSPIGLTYDEADDFCRSQEHNGSCGWRLPTFEELRALVDGCESLELGGACPLDGVTEPTDAFWDDCTACASETGQSCLWDARIERNSCPWPFWSSYHRESFDAMALSYLPATVQQLTLGTREGYCHMEQGRGDMADVLCILDEEVRDCSDPAETRYTDAGWTVSGDVVSADGDLSWTQSAAQAMSAADAASYCDALDLGGSTDWRLPTVEELRTLVVGCVHLVKADEYFACNEAPGDQYPGHGVCCPIADSNCLDSSCQCDDYCQCTRTLGYADQCYWEKDVWTGDCDKAFWSASAVGDMAGHHWAMHFGDIDMRATVNWTGPQIAPLSDSTELAVRCVRN